MFTGKEIIEENPAALIPLMFRVAVEEFSKTCKNEFKIIECRHETKLSSNWKPSLSDILIARKHQVRLLLRVIFYRESAYLRSHP